MLPSLIKCFGPVLLAGAIFRVTCDVLMMITPQIMKRMIPHVTLIELGADGIYPWQGKMPNEHFGSQWEWELATAKRLVVEKLETDV